MVAKEILQATPPPLSTNEVEALSTSSLKNLQSDSERKVMDLVDKLRRQGLSSIIELPQLVVCGDQSSGKSSVLEAITEIPFPRKENLCTRFATEIILRRGNTISVSVRIVPDKLRIDEEIKRLATFDKAMQDLKELPDIIEEATVFMGLGRVGEINSKAFSRDVLSVEICKPNQPQLTLVDLPGLIHATNKAQNELDKKLIFNLVKDYMKNPRTIILAVVSAKNDFANQVILDYCQKIDKKGKRTLGIITKPDFLRPDSENEKTWLDLAQNKDIYLERGWHMLKNRADNEMHFTFAERNEAEEVFFSTGRYVNVSRDCVGITALRTRLSSLLLQHLINELPALKEEMGANLKVITEELLQLGLKRETSVEQRMLLMQISTRINYILTAAVNGNYAHRFFNPVSIDSPMDKGDNIRRFRAVVQSLNMKFARSMDEAGHRYEIHQDRDNFMEDDKSCYSKHKSSKAQDATYDEGSHFPAPKFKDWKKAIEWASEIQVRSRGHELPGSFNPEVISQLFWEQSKPWEEITNVHIDHVDKACREFVYSVIRFTAPAEFQEPLATFTIDAALNAALKAAREELSKLLKDELRHPMTYSQFYALTIQSRRKAKYKALLTKAREKAISENGTDSLDSEPDSEMMEGTVSSIIEQSMEVFSAEEALESMTAYYKDELKYFVHAITKQVIERYLVEPLPQNIVSPMIVAQMTDEEVAYIASEPHETIQKRSFLEQRKAMLEQGLRSFKEAMGELKR